MTDTTDPSQTDERTFAVTDRDGSPAMNVVVLPTGARVDRYTILEHVGAGGMGVVYKAYDPELDRRVALKLLRIAMGFVANNGYDGRARLLREAQALARLSHPNVVTVFDVGVFDEQIFIAMEYVEGESLRQWLRSAPRTPAEVLAVLLPAGRGLLAAHRAGLIHRDFKPDNVFIGSDGRVRVLDFGLARAGGDALESADEREESQSGDEGNASSVDRLLDTPITRAGNTVGTPPYMSPEQHLCQPLNAAADQFSFCVTLYEALVGVRPFRAQDRSQFLADVAARRLRPPPEDIQVPEWLLQAARRGISARPDDRFADMQSLLTVLEKDPVEAKRQTRATRAKMLASAMAGLVVAGASFSAWRAMAPDARLCQGGTAKLTAVWNPAVQAKLDKTFADTGHPDARDRWSRIQQLVTDDLSRWSTMHIDTCEATHVRGEQSDVLLDLRMTCLDHHLSQVAAFLGVLAEADESLVDRAVADAQKLDHLSVCENSEYLQKSSGLMEPVPSPALQPRIDELKARITRVDVLEKMGRLPQGKALATDVLRMANNIGYRPMQAEAEYHLASILERLSEFEQAESHLEQALFWADASGHEVYRAKAASLFAVLLGSRYHQFKHARSLERQARAAIERLGNDEVLLSEWHNHNTLNRIAEGRLNEALEHVEQARKINERLYGPRHLRSAADQSNLGLIYFRKGKYDDAIRALDKAYEISKDLLGPNNVRVAIPLYNLGSAYRQKRDFKKALDNYQRALDIRIRSHGRQHRSVASLFEQIGLVYEDLREPEKARAQFNEALAIAQKLADNESHAQYLVNRGSSYLRQRQFDEAEQDYEGALSTCEEKEATCLSKQIAEYLFEAAQMMRDHGRGDTLSTRLAQRALAIVSKLPALVETRQQIETWLGMAPPPKGT